MIGGDKRQTAFEMSGAKRIVAATKWVEAQPRNTPGGQQGGPSIRGSGTSGLISNITSLSNGTSFSYTLTLGSRDMTSNATIGGDWVSAGNTTYTAFAEETHAAPINIGEYVSLKPRGSDSNGTAYLTIVGAPKTALVTISANTAGTTSFNPYTAKTQTGNITLSIYNGFEDTLGSPGKLGVTVNSNGTISNGTCVVKPVGNATVSISWDYANSRWTFAAPNSAQ